MTRLQYGWLLTVSVDVGILIFVPVQARHLTKAQALLVAWVALVVVQTAMALSWKARTKKEGITVPRSFFWKAGMVALLTGIMTSVMVAQVAQPSSLMDLANSTIPLEAIQSQQRRLVVEMLRKVIVATRANSTAIKNAKPVSPAIYTPASFATLDVMKNTVSQLQQSVNADLQYEAQLSKADKEFHEQMSKVDPAYLQSWDATRKSEVDYRAEAARLEQLWWTSFQDLYSFTEGHATDIAVQDDKIGIHDESVRSAFNAKLTDSEQKYSDFQTHQKADIAAHEKAQQ